MSVLNEMIMWEISLPFFFALKWSYWYIETCMHMIMNSYTPWLVPFFFFLLFIYVKVQEAHKYIDIVNDQTLNYSAKMKTLTESVLLREFHSVGRGFPWTTSHSASTQRFLYLTSTVGNFTSNLPKKKKKNLNQVQSNRPF